MIVAAVVFIVSGSRLVWHYYQMYAGESSYEEIRQEVIIEVPEEAATPAFSTLSINFDVLNNINKDIIAWLYLPGTPVSYPILYGKDNQAYLRTTYDKKYNVLGSIFEDYRNDPDFQDKHTVIYGHNTSNDSMFGSLKKYKDQDYASAHKEIHILRKDETLVYEIFSVYETLATSDTYVIGFSSEESYADYLKAMASKSVVRLGEPPESGQIITLSTCTGGDKTMRLVLQAKFIESHPVAPQV